MTTRAAIYVRQSLNVKLGIERQLKLTRKLATDKGWSVVAEYEDNDTSAAKLRGAKTGWARMIRDRETFDAVIAVDLDRLLRSIRDLVTLVEMGVIISTVSGDLDTTTSEGKFRATIMAGVAEFENGRRVERLIRGAEQRIATGMPLTAGRPYGYEPDMITLRPAEAKVIAEATRNVIRGIPLSSQIRGMNEEQIPTKSGGPWTSNQLRLVLLRQRNSGRLIRHGVVQPVSQIQAAVTPEEFDACRSILEDPTRKGVPGKLPDIYWLSSLMVCGACGRIMRQAKDGKKRQYLCTSFWLKRPDGGLHVAIQAEIAEAVVQAAFVEWAADNGGTGAPPTLSELNRIHFRLIYQEKARAAATHALMMTGADRVTIASRLAEIDRKVERLVRRRAWDITRKVEGVDWSQLTQPSEGGSPSDVSTRSGRLTIANMWWINSTWETRRTVVQALFRIEVIKDSRVRGARRLSIALR